MCRKQTIGIVQTTRQLAHHYLTFSKVTFIKGLKQSVTQIVNTLSKTTNTAEQNMKPSAVRLAKAYEPLIKFVGTRHPIPKHDKVLAHPCTIDGLMPGSKDTTPVADFLKNYTPFQVTPYKNPKGSSGAPAGSKYQYTERPLKEGEVSSTAELPLRFQYKLIDEAELEAINSGGAF